jgi:rod shape-determining protein MreD
MLDIVWQRLDTGMRAALPFATALLCAVLSAVRWPLPYFGSVAPPLAFIAVYYWSRHRADLFGPGSAFVIGLLNDVIQGLPMGLSAFVFVLAQQFIYRQRRFFAGHAFTTLWTGFTVTALAVILLQWFLFSLYRWQAMPFGPVVMQFVLSVAIFPLPCWIFIRLQRIAFSQS